MKLVNEKRLGELLCSRLCHDLIAPIGAINTGLELLQDHAIQDDMGQQEIFSLIQQSALTASARLSFFRSAFGGGGDHISLGEAKQLIEQYYTSEKLAFTWDQRFEQSITLTGWGRLILNIVMWVVECAPRGGKITIAPPTAEDQTLAIRIQAEMLVLQEGIEEALQGKVKAEDLTPRTIQSYFIYLLTQHLQTKAVFSQEDKNTLVLKVEASQ